MIQLDCFAKGAPASAFFRVYPITFGRSDVVDFSIKQQGVWDQHGTILFDGEKRQFLVEANSGAIVTLNGARVEKASLKNGDVIMAGAARILFFIAPARQKSPRFLENLFWFSIAVTLLAQLGFLLFFSVRSGAGP